MSLHQSSTAPRIEDALHPMADVHPFVQLARRHVASGERCVVRQELLITRLKIAGGDATNAEKVLVTFYTSLALLRGDLAFYEGVQGRD